MGVPRLARNCHPREGGDLLGLAGSGYILGAVVIAPLVARLLKRRHSAAPRGHYP